MSLEDVIQEFRDRTNSQIYTILMKSCVVWNVEAIRRNKQNTYKATIKHTVLYAAGA